MWIIRSTWPLDRMWPTMRYSSRRYRSKTTGTMYSVLCEDIHHHQTVFIACLAVPPWIAHRLVYFALLRFASLRLLFIQPTFLLHKKDAQFDPIQSEPDHHRPRPEPHPEPKPLWLAGYRKLIVIPRKLNPRQKKMDMKTGHRGPMTVCRVAITSIKH